MSPREKKLLIFFAAAGFLILNIFAFRFFMEKRIAVQAQRTEAVRQLDAAEMFRASREQVANEMEWLATNEPQPTVKQDVQTALQSLVEREAKNAGLTIKSQKLLPVDDTSGIHYQRAKIEISVTGPDESLYRWLDHLNIPTEFKAATFIRLTPNREDDTKIDCTAIIEQWFVPTPPEGA